MGHLFLDIETYSSAEDADSSLNPYLAGAKVLVVAYSYYEGFKPPRGGEVKAPVFLVEWEKGEKELLLAFYRFLKQAKLKDPYLKVTGFNVLKFDLPYLFARMKLLGIADEKELYELLFRPFGLDLMQLSAMLPLETKKYEQPWGLSQKKASEFFGLQQKEGTGLDCSKWYDAKEYDRILRYCTEEFNLEQMLDCFYLYVLEKHAEKGVGK